MSVRDVEKLVPAIERDDGVVAGRINDAGRLKATDPDLRVLIEKSAEIGVLAALSHDDG
jgi:hypothetical protein